jgi:hypothetical protein
MDWLPLARTLAVLGIVLLLAAGGLALFSRLEISPDSLPGNLVIERDNFTCIIPLAVSLGLSLILTLVLNLVIRLIGK